MRKVKAIYYLDKEERSSIYSKGILLVLEDGTNIEMNTTDIVADHLTNEPAHNVREKRGKNG